MKMKIFWNDISVIFSVTNVAKFRAFQYRLLHRGIITNIRLCKWNLSEHDRCTFCQKERETYSHLFYECSIIKEMWTEVNERIMYGFDKNICALSVYNVITNRVSENRRSVKNFICLLFKQYICRTYSFNNNWF